MSVIVKTECQKCEDVREEEFDGVLVLAFRRNEDGSTSFPYWGHDITIREVTIALLGYFEDKVEEISKENGMSPLEFLTYVLHHGKLNLAD